MPALLLSTTSVVAPTGAPGQQQHVSVVTEVATAFDAMHSIEDHRPVLSRTFGIGY
jgi:hypothetical protein